MSLQRNDEDFPVQEPSLLFLSQNQNSKHTRVCTNNIDNLPEVAACSCEIRVSVFGSECYNLVLYFAGFLKICFVVHSTVDVPHRSPFAPSPWPPPPIPHPCVCTTLLSVSTGQLLLSPSFVHPPPLPCDSCPSVLVSPPLFPFWLSAYCVQ